MALEACKRSTPWCLLALRVGASGPKKAEEKQAEGPPVAALEQYKVARQCTRKAAVHQDIEADVLPRVCGQLGTEVASNRVARDWLVPPVGRLLLRGNPWKEVQELWQQPEVASMQHVPRHRRSGIDGNWTVFSQLLAPQKRQRHAIAGVERKVGHTRRGAMLP